MQYLSVENAPRVHTLVSVDPDKLIELGHRLKQHAMDFALQGESLTVPLTDKILLVYEPADGYVKPNHTFGAPAILAITETEGRLQ